MTCKDCLHYEACRAIGGKLQEHYMNKCNDVKCEYFKDKSEWVHFPYKPLPLLKDGDPSNTDVYCPSCMEDLSGYYIGNPLNMAVCFNCGEIINITESITREEAENAFAERNKK